MNAIVVRQQNPHVGFRCPVAAKISTIRRPRVLGRRIVRLESLTYE